MTDMITVREQCPHGQYEQHLLYTAIHHTIPDVVCPGGREIVLQQAYGKWEPENVKSLKIWMEVGND